MPATDHLIRLGYLFEVLADDHAPEALQKEVRDYLYSDHGMGRVTQAMNAVENGQDVRFNQITDKARPIALNTRVVRTCRAWAEVTPKLSARDQLILALVAQMDFIHENWSGDRPTQTAVRSADAAIRPSFNYVLVGELGSLIESRRPDSFEDGRSDSLALTSAGHSVIQKLLRAMRAGQAVSGPPEIAQITDQLRD
jgi:hypothetical protein